MKIKLVTKGLTAMVLIVLLSSCDKTKYDNQVSLPNTPVDYVNPYMGNISHMLVPTFPTIHLPNSMLRVYPERNDYTGDRLHGLPLIVTSHRGSSAFNLSPYRGSEFDLKPVLNYSYDQEKITPYSYQVYLDEQNISLDYGLSHQSGMYEISLEGDLKKDVFLILNSKNGFLQWDGTAFSGYQNLANNTKVFIYFKPEHLPKEVTVLKNGASISGHQTTGKNASLILKYAESIKKIAIQYGVSFISELQAKANMKREIEGKTLEKIQLLGKEIWNESLGKIQVKGGDIQDEHVFYTSLYRCFERPVCISEDGQYFSAFDGKVHQDNGRDFYTDDWIWDSYRAHHPLRVLIDPKKEQDILNSFILMSEQMDNFWLPTFPEITGDSRRMNSNHGVAAIIDGYRKGLTDFDLEAAYKAAKGAITQKTLAPWSGKPAGWLDSFYKEHGYIPALYPDEEETVEEVNHFEKRQPVAVSLGTAYDQWCLSQIAKELHKQNDYKAFLNASYNYRNLFNTQTLFFHPKDKEGKFIEPFDYVFSGGLGARNYYGENNAWTYRWDVQHNIADLINLMGGNESFISNLDAMFSEPMGKGKSQFYAQLPDQTGNVGQFSMANEPSLHIPYLYNYAGAPWKTQKRIHKLIHTWFRNDLMGVPGDEDGGGMSSFVVFSQLGFYPVTPGLPIYNIGSPFFEKSTIELENGKKFTIIAENYSMENKYIQSATLNGTPLNKAWFTHQELMQGGTLKLLMGSRANKTWGSNPAMVPPSAEPYIKTTKNEN
ncbi:GH92 family glycosyl hydrolase [Galbibacter pacificus]|uniref:GH92 family glycosyl hydrolase n=1 Tax=Galbibacter pacificus TaxID=2996052 RepID=A0ABT6FMQ5_9FLAO|nr:GH92 family glycosyl hydrolase [Galbibacter pacificus]MDG3581071.1 GH92 family glycosyl hydrolase [Galbibacter pacificus]MDG3584549.1 GH92 family glycosyl hydrolase [Galbibacter pacificus]